MPEPEATNTETAVAPFDQAEANRREFQEKLKSMGLTRETVRKMLIGGGSGDWLKRKVARRVQIVDWLADGKQVDKALKVMGKIARDKTVGAKERVAAGQCIAQLAGVKINQGKAIIQNADPDDDEPPPQQSKPQLSVNLNFPPVVSSQRPAIEVEEAEAKDG